MLLAKASSSGLGPSKGVAASDINSIEKKRYAFGAKNGTLNDSRHAESDNDSET